MGCLTAISLASMGKLNAQESTEKKATKVEIGKPAIDFTVTGIDGKEFKLSDRMGKDKNIVLMFSRAHW